MRAQATRGTMPPKRAAKPLHRANNISPEQPSLGQAYSPILPTPSTYFHSSDTSVQFLCACRPIDSDTETGLCRPYLLR